MVAMAYVKSGKEKRKNPRTRLSAYSALYSGFLRGGRTPAKLRALRGDLELKRQEILSRRRGSEERLELILLEACKEALVGKREFWFEVVGVYTPRQRREFPESILQTRDFFRDFGIEVSIECSERVGDRITAVMRISW